MAQIVVRKLEESVKRGLKRRAARHGRSMEEEVRAILRDAVKRDDRPAPGLGTRIAELFKDVGLEEDIPEIRGETPRPAEFDE
jgi:plasmid stability protein